MFKRKNIAVCSMLLEEYYELFLAIMKVFLVFNINILIGDLIMLVTAESNICTHLNQYVQTEVDTALLICLHSNQYVVIKMGHWCSIHLIYAPKYILQVKR